MAPRPQKQCIFCSNPANSKEHFWSEWMHPLLPELPDPRHGRRVTNFHPSEGRREEGIDGRSGGLETIKIRVVCDACNSTWMNRLESEVRPLITPIIEGSPVALDFEQMAVIARWITLKCIVAEHGTRDTDVTPRHDRIAFQENGSIPQYFHIYMANHNMEHATGFHRHSLCLSLKSPAPDPPLMGAAKNIQTISFMLGRVFVHLNAARINDYSIESRYLGPSFWAESRIWPLQHHDMVWPRRPLLDQHGIGSISGALEAIIAASTLTWGDLPQRS